MLRQHNCREHGRGSTHCFLGQDVYMRKKSISWGIYYGEKSFDIGNHIVFKYYMEQTVLVTDP